MKKGFGAPLLPVLSASLSLSKRRIKNILQSVVVLLLVVALARPQSGQKTQQVKSEGIEIVFVADVSESMMAEDVKPNRLTEMKMELSQLIDKLPNHRVGLIAFAGSASLLSPLTTDPAALKMYIDSLSPLSVSTQGTNFARAIEESAQAFERGGVGEDPQGRVTRVIVIVSDGEDQEPGALAMAAELVKKGIRIFTVAYGTVQGGLIPERDTLGFLRGNKKDASGADVITKVNGDALKALANAGHGSFYHATFGGHHMADLLSDIDHLEKSAFESQLVTAYEDRFQIFLLWALVMALVELALGERRPPGRLWKGRFEVSQR